MKDFPLICYRHSGFGILKKFLQTCRGISTTSTLEVHTAENTPASANKEQSPGLGQSNQTLRTHDLVSMGAQILNAIMHLHKFGVIHKDIASRNCLVSEPSTKGAAERFYVQLADYALSRDIFESEYHTPSVAALGEDARPVKWMSPEAIRSNVFNSASDVV